MDQLRWNTIEEILQAALDLDTDERPAYVGKACGSDAELKREIITLLSSGQEARERTLTGRRIGHYLIERRIGVGGMAEVYRAWDERLRRAVALKALPAAFTSDPGRLHRFEQEAFAASRLNHPNIVTIHETLAAESVHLIATEYVEGRTLRDVLTDPETGTPRKLPPDFALDVTMQVAAALEAAHTAWIIHRDIKPENIMVRSDGLVKVLDFGIAKLAEDPSEQTVVTASAVPSSSTLTFPGAVLGTASYMSPEQAAGAPLDGRTDLFSLGVVLYEMLTGERHFALDHLELPHGVPKPLERALRRMLQPNREQRYASAAELLHDLREIKRRIEGRKARRLVGVSAGVAVLAIAVTAAAALLSITESWDERVLRDGHTAAARQAIFSPDGRLVASCGEDGRVIIWDFARRQRLATLNHPANRLLFTSDGRTLLTAGTDGNIAAWDVGTWRMVRVYHGEAGEIVAMALSPDSALLAAVSPHTVFLWDVQRGTRIRQWKKVGASYGTILFAPHGRQLLASFSVPGATLIPSNSIAVSPDKTRIAALDSGGVMSFYRAAWDGQPALIARSRGHHDHGRSVAFSPDGSLVASAAEDIILWDAATQRKIARFEYSAIVWSVAFSPDGRWLISSHGDGAVLVWDVAERALVAGLNEHSGAVRGVAFSSHGRRLATAGDDRSVILWDVVRGRKQMVLNGHATRVTSVAFSADGKQLGSADQDGVAILWDLETQQPRLTVRGPDSPAYCVALSHDGRYIATTEAVYDVRDGHVVMKLGTEYELGHAYGAAFSPDGRQLATATDGGCVVIWDVHSGKVVEAVRVLHGPQICIRYSPDGKRLVTGEDEGVVRLWSAAPLRQVAVLGRHAARVKSVAFSPDGRTVASAGDDKTIALWDVRRHTLKAHVGTHTSPVYAVDFSPDGRQLASGEHDRSVRVYTRRRTLWGVRLD